MAVIQHFIIIGGYCSHLLSQKKMWNEFYDLFYKLMPNKIDHGKFYWSHTDIMIARQDGSSDLMATFTDIYNHTRLGYKSNQLANGEFGIYYVTSGKGAISWCILVKHFSCGILY